MRFTNVHFNYVNKIKLIPFFLGLYLLTGNGLACSSVYDIELLERKISINLRKKDASNILEYIAVTFKIPIGVEHTYPNQKDMLNENIDINFNEASLKEVLNYLFPEKSPYEWSVNQGVVNIYPKQSVGNILSTRVKRFDIDEADPAKVLRFIYNLRELKENLKKIKLLPGGILTVNSISEDSLKLTFRLRNMSLREVLNRIGIVTGFWTVVIVGDKYFIRI